MTRQALNLAARLAICFSFISPAAAIAQTEASCTQAAATDVLAPAASHSLLAKNREAIFLNQQWIQWPGMTSGTNRFVLVHSPNSTLRMVNNQLPADVQQIPLALLPAIPDTTLLKTFSWLEPGVVLALAADSQRLASLLKGQLWLVALDANQLVIRATELQTAQALDSIYAAAQSSQRFPLGLQFLESQARLSLWAPTANRVYACIYPSASATNAVIKELSVNPQSGIWSVDLLNHFADYPKGSYYTFLVDVHSQVAGRVLNRVTDPYSVSLNANSARSYLVDLNAANLKPLGWNRLPKPHSRSQPSDMVVYELHVRDFSQADQSVKPAWRGKYLAFTESASLGVKHLKTLASAGITDIHLLPIFDLATVPETNCIQPNIDVKAVAQDPASEQPQAAIAAIKEQDCFNWGYDPLHFGAPEGSFATQANDGAVRIRELRAMVLALKKIGFRVGMDVVYNHTSAAGQERHSVLDKIVPGYYQRLSGKGELETSTCCANTATEHLMMARLMRDTVHLWADQYGIDSFRFDLMGHQPKAAMVAMYKELNQLWRRIDFIGEGWNFGEIANNQRFVQAAQGELNGTGIGTFSDRARDAVRGGGCCDSGTDAVNRKGFVNFMHWDTQRPEALRLTDLVRLGLAGTLKQMPITAASGNTVLGEAIDYAGQKAGYATHTMDVVNYVENHDNQTLFDINVFKLPPNTLPMDRAKVQVLALAVTSLSFGVAYFHAGGELLRSKSLDRNSYDSGDWFNRIDWSGQSNGFASGVPIKNDNGNDWAIMQKLLRDKRIRVSAKEIAWTRQQFLQLLAVRKSLMPVGSNTAERVLKELQFYNTGPQALSGLIVAKVFDPTLARWVIYALNAKDQAQRFQLPGALAAHWRPHPVVKQPWFKPISQRQLTIPGRSWAVWAH